MSLPISAQGLPASGVACPPSVWWALSDKFHPFLMSAFSFDLSSVIWFVAVIRFLLLSFAEALASDLRSPTSDR